MVNGMDNTKSWLTPKLFRNGGRDEICTKNIKDMTIFNSTQLFCWEV
jgi:hypothetical protein